MNARMNYNNNLMRIYWFSTVHIVSQSHQSCLNTVYVTLPFAQTISAIVIVRDLTST